MDVTPEFGVTKCIYKDVPWSNFLHKKQEFKKLNDDHEFLSYFTNWQDQTMNSIWVGKQHLVENGDFSSFYELGDYTQVCPETLYGGTLVQKTHPVPERSSDPCVESGFGMWNEKIYHFLPDKPPSSAGDEI